MTADWHQAALDDIAGLSNVWVARYGWDPRVVDDADHIDVYLTFEHPNGPYLLRLRYEPNFLEVGRREDFCNPDNPDEIGPEHWPPEGGAFKRGKQAICIPGTFGYHRKLHANDNKHPPEATTLGELAHRIQRALATR